MAWIDANDRPEQGIIVGKILDWFVSQPEEVQQVVLRRVPGSMKLAYANALRSLADQLDPQTTQIIRQDPEPESGAGAASHRGQSRKASGAA